MNKFRTHNCSELTEKDIGKNIRLSGWIHRKRDHGNLLFVDIRDHFGITQCVIENKEKNFEDEASKYFMKKYPMIKNNMHVKSTMFLIGVKMLVVEGWQEINDSKLFYEELERRLKRLFGNILKT